jgi:superfamily II DNA or RNA helicase
VTTEAPAWPVGKVYFSPRVYDFQARGIAESVLMGDVMAVWDTGIGKSHLAMGASGILFEDGLIDLVLLVAEKNKIHEWVADFKKFTALEPFLYHGPKRKKLFERHRGPDGFEAHTDVVVSTYETLRSDVATFVKGPGRGTSIRDGEMLTWLRGRRIMVVYDEIGKLGPSRSSKLYKAHAYLLKELRKLDPNLRVLGLTATPISRDWENAFNELRLVQPEAMPTVGDFDKLMVKSRHPVYGTPTWRGENIEQFVAMCEPLIIRKRKTDADVIDQFPKQVEEVRRVSLIKAHKELYDLVESLAFDDAGNYMEVPGLWTLLRQVAGHPAALCHSAEKGTQLAQMLCEGLGESFLRAVPSSKSEALLSYLKPLVLGQGAKVMVFTFFGQSVLRELKREISAEGMAVYPYHGGMSAAQQRDMLADFRRSSGAGVLLASDSGARGINVPEATYVVEYEVATHAVRLQRMNRSHRIDSTAETVHCMSLVLDGTVEENVVATMLARNTASDTLLGDHDAGADFTTAEDRRRIFESRRKKR